MALSLPAGLPSSVLFLCIRHADCRDQSQAQSLPGAAVAAMKTALKVKKSLTPAVGSEECLESVGCVCSTTGEMRLKAEVYKHCEKKHLFPTV